MMSGYARGDSLSQYPYASCSGTLTNLEDAFVERKSTGDMRDLLKTAVGLANSMPVGYPAILFYGVTNKGEPEGKANLDRLQRTLSEKLSEAYPPIYYLPKVLRHKGKEFLAVIIPGSEDRPHFAGQSYMAGAGTSLAGRGWLPLALWGLWKTT